MFQKQAFDCLSRGKTKSLGASLLDYRLAKRVIKAYKIVTLVKLEFRDS